MSGQAWVNAMNAIPKAFGVIAGLFIIGAIYVWMPGKGLWGREDKIAKSDWILIGIVLGAFFLLFVYAFSKGA
jgi:hypothetical protein